MVNVPTPAFPHPEVLFASVTLATPTLRSAWILTSVPCSIPALSTALTPRGLTS